MAEKKAFVNAQISPELKDRLNAALDRYSEKMREQGMPFVVTKSSLICMLIEEWIKGQEE
jgi:hypothetical protein